MLTNRQSDILKLIVDEYIKLAKPVGSNLICDELKCSSATIRSEMSILEDLGLLEKTHTSSGRIPSEIGYRYYVDHLMKLKEINGEDLIKLQTLFTNSQLQLNDYITKSLEIISEMTTYTSIVLGSNAKDNCLKEIEVIPMNDGNLIIIVITDKGHVEHKNIKVENVSLEDIKQTVSLINNLIIGTPIEEVSTKLEFEIKPIISKYVKDHEILYNVFYNVFNNFKTDNINIVGKNNILKQPEFDNVDKIKDIFNKLDNVDTINNIEEIDNNINIYIGKENNLDDDMTVIKTKYNNGYDSGTIAIIGPKRMDYERVVQLLDYIKKTIEKKETR
ncbi:MAG: heat-inducible transcriptional repressor HrcA [Bacilli bacterium]